MSLQAMLGPALLLIACLSYVFWPQTGSGVVVEKTRRDYLEERKAVIYDNLRDLNFEYRAGKYPETDYHSQRTALEAEAANVLAEMDLLAS